MSRMCIMKTSADVFNTLAGLGSDQCGLSQRDLQNTNNANYTLMNFREDEGMRQTINIASQYPTMNYTGNSHMDIGGRNIDENSELVIRDLSKTADKLSLQQRSHLTLPYLGRGYVDVEADTAMRNGAYSQNKKSINPSSEISHANYRHTPMLPHLKASIQNPVNLVESSADSGWIRGGLPSREYIKSQCSQGT